MEIKELIESINKLEFDNYSFEQDNSRKCIKYTDEFNKKCSELYKALVGHTIWDGKVIYYIYEAHDTYMVCVQINDSCIYPKLVIDYDNIKDCLFTLDTATKTYKTILEEYISILNKINGKEL